VVSLRYKHRTLLILLAVLPPLLWIGWGKYQAWKAEQERLKMLQAIPDGFVVEVVWTDEQPGEPLPIGVPEEPRE
jgi:hypothetical protein